MSALRLDGDTELSPSPRVRARLTVIAAYTDPPLLHGAVAPSKKAPNYCRGLSSRQKGD